MREKEKDKQRERESGGLFSLAPWPGLRDPVCIGARAGASARWVNKIMRRSEVSLPAGSDRANNWLPQPCNILLGITLRPCQTEPAPTRPSKLNGNIAKLFASSVYL